MVRRVWKALLALVVLALVAAFAVTPAKAETAKGLWGKCEWEINNGVLTVHGGTADNRYWHDSSPWVYYKDEIDTVVITESVIAPEDIHALFAGLDKVTSFNLSGLNTSKTTDMSYMFYGCKSITELDLSDFNTSKVRNMNWMFMECRALTSLNLSSFNTSNVTNMYGMFQWCSALTSLDVTGFDTSRVVNMANLFCNCSSLTELDVTNFVTTNVTDMSSMFYSIQGSLIAELDVSSFDTSNVTNMASMFHGQKTITTLDLSNFNTAKVTDMRDMFYDCRALESVNLSSFNTSNVTCMYNMFKYCVALKSLDLSSFNTAKVTNMQGMFGDCYALASLNVTSFDTSNVKDMGWMFSICSSLTSLDLSSFDTSGIDPEAEYQGAMKNMFVACNALKSFTVSEKYVQPEEDGMWSVPDGLWQAESDGDCYSGTELAHRVAADTYTRVEATEGWTAFGTCEYTIDADTLIVRPIRDREFGTLPSIRGTFPGAKDSAVKYVVIQPGVKAAENFAKVFYNCSNLESIDLSGLDTTDVTDMSSAFEGLDNLQTFKIGENFVQPTEDGKWSAPLGDWEAASDGAVCSGYALAHRRGPDTYSRWVETIIYPDWVYTDDGGMYYYESADKMVTNDWRQTPSGLWVYLGLDGRAVLDGVAPYKGNYYFVRGGMVQTSKSGWKQIDGDWYYFGNAYGAAYKNQWLKYGSVYVYFGSDGKLVQEGWAVTGGKYYYIRAYVPVANDWVQYGSKWYYFNGSGVCTRVYP